MRTKVSGFNITVLVLLNVSSIDTRFNASYVVSRILHLSLSDSFYLSGRELNNAESAPPRPEDMLRSDFFLLTPTLPRAALP